jgi:electron transport complex protein RnfD
VFAIVVVKCIFGGIGCNFANPAMTARALLLVSFTGSVAGGVTPGLAEVVAGATPLSAMKEGAAASELPSLLDMLLGLRGGAMGEVCAIALLIGGAYLLIRRVISWHAPAGFILTVFLLSLIIKGDATLALYQVLSGGLLLGAFFMATDYSTTPINKLGKLVFGIGCGLITVLIRTYGSYPEGVSFAILLMNILSPYIEKLCARRPFGGAKR